MRLLRRLFGLRAIYFKQTAKQILYLYGFSGLGLVVITLFFDPITSLERNLMIVAFSLVGLFCLRSVIRTIIVNQYLKRKPSTPAAPSTEVINASMNSELDNIDRFRPLATYGDSQLSLAIFDFYRKTRDGDYLTKQAYYLVLETPLERLLPHIVFDSKIAKGRQFRHTFLKVQRISVQGPFDAIFDTYVPKTYAVDSLSFVSPEVMEVLMDARSYDIEIINNKLLLYAPLIDNSEITSMVAKARTIARELNDNIDTYRDDRLKGLERETSVTPFARSLLRSPFKYLVFSSLLGLGTIGLVVWACLYPKNADDILLNQISFLVYGTLIANAWRAGSIIRDNKRALTGFRILYQTDRGRPVVPTTATAQASPVGFRGPRVNAGR